MILRFYYLRFIALFAALILTSAQAGGLHEVIKAGELRQVDDLLLMGFDINERDQEDATPLHWAAYLGHVEIVKLLIARGADVFANENAICAIPDQSIMTGGIAPRAGLLNNPQAKINYKQNGGVTPLHWAAAGGHKTVVDLLIAEGANINARSREGITPLSTATGMNHTDLATMLRQLGGRE